MSQPYQPYQLPAVYAYRQSARDGRNGMGVASLVLGILALISSLVPIIGVIAWVLGPLGLIFGGVGLSRSSRQEATNRGAALAGVITSAVALAICVVWVFAIVGAAASAPVAARQPAVIAAEPAAPSGPLTAFGDGTYEVGIDVKPGKYKTAGDRFCYWERSKNGDGSFGDIIANELGDGPRTLSIRQGEYFKTQGCGTWSLAS